MRFVFTICCWLLVQRLSAQNPAITVIDTDFSKGRLQNKQSLTLNDAVKLHGHLCDGLVVGFLGLREALYKLYPDSCIDRTNNRVISKSSPCISDIAIMLTGARYQFNTYYVTDSISYQFIVQRIDNGKTIGIRLKPGLLPLAIDSLGKLAIKGELDACGIDRLRTLENEFTAFLLQSSPPELFVSEEMPNFIWQPVLYSNFIKTDVLNKKLQKCLPK